MILIFCDFRKWAYCCRFAKLLSVHFQKIGKVFIFKKSQRPRENVTDQSEILDLRSHNMTCAQNCFHKSLHPTVQYTVYAHVYRQQQKGKCVPITCRENSKREVVERAPRHCVWGGGECVGFPFNFTESVN